MKNEYPSQSYSTQTIGELVAKNYRLAGVFKKFDIDFCCGGKKTLAEVCAEKGIEWDTLVAEVEKAAAAKEDHEHNYEQWEVDFLADYIVNVHHRYVRENIPPMREYTAKVARVHGDVHPEVVEIARLFEEVASELEQHMMKEEHILFPYLKQLAAAERTGETAPHPPFGTVENPIRLMEQEHEHAGNLMKQIRQLSNNFVPPEDACNTYRVSFAKLNEFEEDLHHHIHLENNILFPRAIEIEQRLVPDPQ